MAERSFKEEFKRFCDWIWHSDSIWSYIVFLVLVFIFIKLIFLPGLGFVFGSALPMAIVESSSMDHNSLNYCTSYSGGLECIEESKDYDICGKKFEEKMFFNIEAYWNSCGGWYESRNITKEQFSDFRFKNGFRKGDLMFIFGWIEPKVGDSIVFNAGRNHPIIHRIISLNPLQTKGDHNSEQLSEEKIINTNQVIGVAVFKIPYVGWIKLFFYELFNKIF